MFNIFVANTVWAKIDDLENYLINELQLSETAALQRTNRMRLFLKNRGFLPTKNLTKVLSFVICRMLRY